MSRVDRDLKTWAAVHFHGSGRTREKAFRLAASERRKRVRAVRRSYARALRRHGLPGLIQAAVR